MGNPERVVVMARTPEPGRVKTRLIERFGAEGAAELQRAFTQDLLQRLCAAQLWEVVVYLTGADEADLLAGQRVSRRDQPPGDLGARILFVFEQSVQDGVGRTVVLGTDSPDLPLARVQQAFVALDQADAVVVPAVDGGYTLLAAAEPPQALLREIPWGGPDVLAATLQRAQRAGLRLAVLEPWYDVDRYQDAAFLAVHLELLEQCGGEQRAPRTRRLLSQLLRRSAP